jgi:Subtilase family
MISTPREIDPKSSADPYLIWALATNFRDYVKENKNCWLSVVIECKDGETVSSFVDRLRKNVENGEVIWCKIPTLYLAKSPRFEKATICTAQVQIQSIKRLQKEVKRFELGMAVNPVDIKNNLEAAFVAQQFKPVQNQLIVGIIDDFVGFAHTAFSVPAITSKSGTRVEQIWSQSLKRPNAKYWEEAKSSCGYGYELDFSQINSLNELRRAHPVTMPNMTHGSHVASIAAGKKTRQHLKTAENLDQDAAASASIIAVHLPQSTLEDSSGGSMNAQVLDGIRYILAHSQEDAKVVINISYSTHAGAHDGTSILEAAMDELVKLSNGRLAIVLPVGNHYEARSHAKFDLSTNRNQKKLSQKMLWQVLPNCSSTSFMEIWLPFEQADLVEIELTSPQNQTIQSAAVNENWRFGHNPVSPQFAIIFPKLQTSSTKGVMALLVISPTRQDASNIDIARHGLWTVTVGLTDEAKNIPDLTVPVNAWIERNDTIRRAHRQRGQSYFVDKEYEKYGQKPGQASDNSATYIKRFGSRNTIAGGSETIVVGGFQSLDRRAVAYSACSPDVAAVSDENKALRGVRGAGARGISVVRMNGTSVAAPMVTRCIANYFASNASGTKADLIKGLPTLANLRELIPERDGAKQVSN